MMIAAYETQRVHSSLIDALVAQEIKRQNAAREAAEAEKRKRIAADRKRIKRIRRLRYYGHNPRPPLPIRWLLGTYGLIVLAIAEGYGKLLDARIYRRRPIS